MTGSDDTDGRRRWLRVLLRRLLQFALVFVAFFAWALWFFTEAPTSTSTRYLGYPLVLLAGGVVVALVKAVLDPIRVARGVSIPFEYSGESSVVSEDGEARGIRYHYEPRMASRFAFYCFATGGVMLAITAWAPWSGLSRGAEVTWPMVAGLLAIGVMGVVFVWRGVFVKKQLTRGGGLAIEITNDGLRLDGSKLLPWEKIDLLFIDGRGERARYASGILASALIEVRHVQVTVFDETWKYPYMPRKYVGAFDRALPGGRDDFIQIARNLRGAAAAHPHVRLRYAERGMLNLEKRVGEMQYFSSLEEAELNWHRGLDYENTRRKAER